MKETEVTVSLTQNEVRMIRYFMERYISSQIKVPKDTHIFMKMCEAERQFAVPDFASNYSCQTPA